MNNSDSERLIKDILKNSRMELTDPDFSSATMKRIVRVEKKRRILNDVLLDLFVFIATDALICLVLWLTGLSVFDLAEGPVKMIDQLLFQVGQLKYTVAGNNLTSYLPLSLLWIASLFGVRLVMKSDSGLFLR